MSNDGVLTIEEAVKRSEKEIKEAETVLRVRHERAKYKDLCEPYDKLVEMIEPSGVYLLRLFFVVDGDGTIVRQFQFMRLLSIIGNDGSVIRAKANT